VRYQESNDVERASEISFYTDVPRFQAGRTEDRLEPAPLEIRISVGAHCAARPERSRDSSGARPMLPDASAGPWWWNRIILYVADPQRPEIPLEKLETAACTSGTRRSRDAGGSRIQVRGFPTRTLIGSFTREALAPPSEFRI